jgi:hypothetical protein
MSFKLPKKITESSAANIDKMKHDAPIIKKLLMEMKRNYNLAKEKQVIDRGENNWYLFCSLVIDDMKQKVDMDLLLSFLTAHIVDELLLIDKIHLLNYLPNLDKNDEFEIKIKQYLESLFIVNENFTSIMLDDNGKPQLFIQMRNTDENWKKADPEDIHEISDKIKKIVADLLPPKEKLNKFIGFMGNFKNEFITFKIKDLSNKRNKGSRCDQASKITTIKILDAIIGGIDDKEKYNDISQKQVCVMQEFYLRLYNHTKKDNKHWFLTPSEAILINIENLNF